MRFFDKTKKNPTLKEKYDYIKNHFTYWTMNSWNGDITVANNVKLYKLGLTTEQTNKAYELLECENFYDEFNDMLYNSELEVYFNGKSDGYLVLAGAKKYDYKINSWYWNYDDFEVFDEVDDAQAESSTIEYDYELVQAFDVLCDDIRNNLIYQTEHAEIVTEEFLTMNKKKFLRYCD